MIQIIAVLFAIVNGVPSDQSIGNMRSRMQFASMQACEAFLTSESGEQMKAIVMDSEMVKTKMVSVEFKCVEVGEPT